MKTELVSHNGDTRMSIKTPLGVLDITEDLGKIARLEWVGAEYRNTRSTPLLQEAKNQIEAYFDGRLCCFDVPLCPKVTVFEKRVLDALCTIPFGLTATYGQIATALDTSAQAVGMACARNPIPILIPCHRVLSQSGLGGFSAGKGIDTKIALLRLEKSYPYLL